MGNDHRQSHRIFPPFVTGILGIVLAIAVFLLLKHYNTMDCQTIHLTVHSGGAQSLVKIGVGIFILTLIGVPLIVSSAVAGLLTTPLLGAAISSGFAIFALTTAFLLFRALGRDHLLVRKLDQLISKTSWYIYFQESKAGDGLQWTNAQLQGTPLPSSWFAAYCGAVVRHLSTASFVAGAFIAIVVVMFVFSFIGANVGCAVVDYHFGLSIDKYRIPIALSCIMVFLTLRLRPRFIV